MRAMLSFIFEAGITTRVCRARIALRMRVSISATGSVMFIRLLLADLPARLGYAWQFPTQRQLPKTNAAQAKLTHIGTRAPTDAAAVMLLYLELRLPLRLYNHGGLCHTANS